MTQKAITSINESIDRIIQVVGGLTEEVIRYKPSEEEWSILQIVCHLNEALPYWLNEIEKLVETPGQEWGRGITDPDRLSAVACENVKGTDVAIALKELAEVKPKVTACLEKLTEEELVAEAPSRNPRFGTKPLSFIVDHLLDEHVNKHEGQIQRNLSKVLHDK